MYWRCDPCKIKQFFQHLSTFSFPQSYQATVRPYLTHVRLEDISCLDCLTVGNWSMSPSLKKRTTFVFRVFWVCCVWTSVRFISHQSSHVCEDRLAERGCRSFLSVEAHAFSRFPVRLCHARDGISERRSGSAHPQDVSHRSQTLGELR